MTDFNEATTKAILDTLGIEKLEDVLELEFGATVDVEEEE